MVNNMGTIIILSLSFLYIMYLIIEYIYYKNLRKQFKHIVHVNGTRGKSTVTRMIGHILNENGFKTATKTTGTIPSIIYPNKEEKVLFRIGNPNIKEQLKVMRLAKKAGAEVLVVECMAITPQYQNITHYKMLNADITVITNARKDHQEILGETEKEIACSFKNTISNKGVLFVNENISKYYIKKSQSLETKLITFKAYEHEQNIDLYAENVGAALEVANYFNIDEEKALLDLKTYPKDVGSIDIYRKNNHTFINGFSINDVESLKVTLKELDISNVDTYLINNRSDRSYRIKEHLNFLKEIKPKKVIVAGGYYKYFKRNLEGVEVLKYKNIKQLKEEDVVFGFGNFKNKGLKIIKHYQTIN